MAKESRLSQRQDDAILDALKKVSSESQIPAPALVAASIKALEKTWTEDRSITFPFRVVSEKDWKDLLEKVSCLNPNNDDVEKIA